MELWATKGAVFWFLDSVPESDLRLAQHGQLVKITGIASCGSLSLESSYEKATGCIYASTLLYEYRGLTLQPGNVKRSCFHRHLAYCEYLRDKDLRGLEASGFYPSAALDGLTCIFLASTASYKDQEFYLTDQKPGLTAIVKAGSGSKVIPLIVESKLVNTKRCRILSPHLRKWLSERNLSPESLLLRLEEGYVKEGSSVTVFGMLHRNNDMTTIVQPPEVISTGCLWPKLLLPVDIDGMILRSSHTPGILSTKIQYNRQKDGSR